MSLPENKEAPGIMNKFPDAIMIVSFGCSSDIVANQVMTELKILPDSNAAHRITECVILIPSVKSISLMGYITDDRVIDIVYSSGGSVLVNW
jgi:hypothetical protein